MHPTGVRAGKAPHMDAIIAFARIGAICRQSLVGKSVFLPRLHHGLKYYNAVVSAHGNDSSGTSQMWGYKSWCHRGMRVLMATHAIADGGGYKCVFYD